MNNIISILLLLLPTLLLSNWTHLYGSTTARATANYTIPYPGGARYSTMTATNTHIYIFGGVGYNDVSGTTGSLNGLWQFSLVDRTWMKLSGSNERNTRSNYSVPIPGGLGSHTMGMVGSSIYVFGGVGYDDSAFGKINDLWRFSVVDGGWTHVFGNKSVNTLSRYGVPFYPGGLSSHSMVVDGGNGFIYVFGGDGYDDVGFLNDLWRFDIGGSVWDYLSGNQSANIVSDYTVPYPGSVNYHTMSLYGDYLYVFGGRGFDNETLGILNTMWRYSIVNNSWEYVFGSQIINTGSDFNATYPGSIYEHAMQIEDDNLYVLGGRGYGMNYTSGILNDLYSYDISNDTWLHLSGTKIPRSLSNYSAPYPGGLTAHSMAMINGVIYVFGGTGYDGDLNDLWSYELFPTNLVSSEYDPISSQLTDAQSEVSSDIEISSTAVIIDADVFSDSTVINSDVIFITSTDSANSHGMIIIDNAHISVNGTISIYSDIIIQGDTTITTSKCISAYNNSQIIIDLSKRSKKNEQVISYSCSTIPDLDVAIQGSYAEGCIPRYEIQQTSLLLILDTKSCSRRMEQDSIIPIIVATSIAVCVIVVIVLILLVKQNTSVSVVNKNQ